MVLKDFDKNLEKYAKLLISTGINVQPGHTVNIVIDVDQAPLARLLVKEAYAHGASEVIVSWADDFVGRERLLHAAEDRITNVPEYRVAEMNYLLEKKASRLKRSFSRSRCIRWCVSRTSSKINKSIKPCIKTITYSNTSQQSELDSSSSCW